VLTTRALAEFERIVNEEAALEQDRDKQQE
jgi:hypothetical protein